MQQGASCLGCPDQRYVIFLPNLIHYLNKFRILDALSWFDDVISSAVKTAPERLAISVSYYVTDVTDAVEDDVSVKSDRTEECARGISKHSGRPLLGDIVRDYCEDAGTVAVASGLFLVPYVAFALTFCAAACGPDSFNLDVGNAVSERELAIARGTSPCSEVYLHRETYTYVQQLSSATWCYLLTPFQMVIASPGGNGARECTHLLSRDRVDHV